MMLRGPTLLRRFIKDRSGATAALVALAIIPILGLAGFAIDIGHALQVKSALQASTDAAALAAAYDIRAIGNGGSGDPAAKARLYSSASGGKNATTQIAATMSAGYPQLKCFKTTGANCAAAYPYNGIVVRQEATVPTFFAKVMGINSFSVSATAVAGAAGGTPVPLNVMLVLDNTASMQQADNKCSIKNASKLACAQAGVKTLLNELDPSVDQVGLMVFPGYQGSGKYCNSSSHKVARYNGNPNYLISDPVSDYRASDDAKSLDASSGLVAATQGGGSCTKLKAEGGVGTFYHDVIDQAQAKLQATDRPDMQNVMVFLSDGDASASNVPPGLAKKQCQNAVQAAKDAAAQAGANGKGTWVFSIAYGAQNKGGCSTDTGVYRDACYTMKNIASDSAKFYSDNAAGCPSSSNSVSELVSIFHTIAQTLQAPRLLAENTT
jgi:Flp pilus assembly protein TadG